MTPELFIKSIARANQYRIEDIETIGRIAYLYLQEGYHEDLQTCELDDHLSDRETYQEGFLTEAPDLSIYEDSESPEEPGPGATPDQSPPEEEEPEA
jgi:hypothetical protein